MKLGEVEYSVHNAPEDAVLGLLETQLQQVEDVCSCSRCLGDMASMVLNQVKPQYLSDASSPSQEQQDMLANRVATAIERITDNPRHDEDDAESATYRLHNLSEDLVNTVLGILVEEGQDVPLDSEALSFIAAHSLNEIEPRYALTRRGETILRTDQLEIRFMPSTMSAVYRALKKRKG